MKELILSIIFILILLGCSLKKESILIFNPNSSIVDTLSPKIQEFLNKPGRSWHAEHLNVFRDKPETAIVVLNAEETKILVFNAISNSIKSIKLPSNRVLPIGQIYFHNYDSIFIFYEIIDLFRYRNYKAHPDFILIDSSGNLLNSYTLPASLKLYKGEKEGFLFREKLPIFSNRISDNKIYIPFVIYGPKISNPLMATMNTEILCEFNLLTNSVKMLPIRLPQKDIGKKYNSNAGYNSLQFIIRGDKIIYGFEHSSDIYVFDLKSWETKCIENKDDILNNLEGKDTLRRSFFSSFKNIQYVESHNIYKREVRLIDVQNESKFKSFAEIFDSNFNFLGYNFKSDSTRIISQINGQLSYYDSKKKKYYLIDSITFKKVDKETFVKSLSDTKQKKPNQRSSNKLLGSLESRINSYHCLLGIPDNRRVFQIKTNFNCSECMDFLISKIKANQCDTIKNKMYFVFYGDEVFSLIKILNNYGIIPSENVIYDVNCYYASFFETKELSTPYLLKRENGEIEILTFENIVEKLNNK